MQFTKNYGGTIGAESGVGLQLGVLSTEVSGFGNYTQTGKSFWLKGAADSLGNFKLNAYHPENQLTGRFEGKFSQDYREMSGDFSKPDGSNLEAFEFRETDEPGYGGEGIGIAPCPTSNTPAGWKTYINEKYRFCFSYPATYAPIAEPWLEKYAVAGENSREVQELVQEKRYFILQDTQQSGALVSVAVDNETFDLQNLARSAPTGIEDPPEPKLFSNQVFYYYGPGGGGVDYADRFFYDLKCKTLIFAFGPPSDNNVTSDRTRQSSRRSWRHPAHTEHLSPSANGLVFLQQLDDFRAGHVGRSFAVVGAKRSVSAGIKQGLNHFRIVVMRSGMQCREAALLLRIRIGSLAQEHLHQFGIIGSGSAVDDGEFGPVGCDGIGISAVVQQFFRGRQVARRSWRSAAL